MNAELDHWLLHTCCKHTILLVLSPPWLYPSGPLLSSHPIRAFSHSGLLVLRLTELKQGQMCSWASGATHWPQWSHQWCNSKILDLWLADARPCVVQSKGINKQLVWDHHCLHSLLTYPGGCIVLPNHPGSSSSSSHIFVTLFLDPVTL